ncbi:hypothetical protein M2310_001483 [Rhizobium leguminosarum]|uniref:Uncharacterized protein n=1 Tax=Rhizobium esperanzae TaxID=1967781 RepID=A0A7W6UGI6_9HYPH|nr:hypothetical protein [Rhizobium esperanzae]MDH6200812.1 hypothetical protein [Rhizobium leguminosarum]
MFRIDRDLHCRQQMVGLGGNADDRKEFGMLRLRPPARLGSGRVGMDAKGATVVSGDGEIWALPFPVYFLGVKM